jgi:hypothetical protein
MSEKQVELYRLHRTEQSKYVYFILAAAAGGIALAVRLTSDATLHWSLVPLGVAVLSWGLSFYFGCRGLDSVSVLTRANAELLQVQTGEHPKAGRHPQLQQVADEALREVMERENTAVGKNYGMQFRYLVGGAVFFIAWHVLRIVLRS